MLGPAVNAGEADETDCKETAQVLEAMQGVFWMIGKYNGAPIYRQPPNDAGFGQQLFLWFSSQDGIGWKCAANFQDEESCPCALTHPSNAPPKHWYIPGWNEQVCWNCSIMPLTEWQKQEIHLKDTELQELRAKREALEAQVAELQAQPQQQDVDAGQQDDQQEDHETKSDPSQQIDVLGRDRLRGGGARS